MTRTVRLSVPLGCLAAVMLACTTSDSPTMPTASLRAPASALADKGRNDPATAPGHPDTVLVLKRTGAIGADITVSATIGPKGGELRIPAAGVTFTVPAGALDGPTTITMTAKAGLNIAYDFAPHGLVFNSPATLRQELRATWASTYPALFNTVIGGYYEGDLTQDLVDPWGLFAKIVETRPAVLDHGARVATIYINHFSGYLMSSGRSLLGDE